MPCQIQPWCGVSFLGVLIFRTIKFLVKNFRAVIICFSHFLSEKLFNRKRQPPLMTPWLWRFHFFWLRSLMTSRIQNPNIASEGMSLLQTPWCNGSQGIKRHSREGSFPAEQKKALAENLAPGLKSKTSLCVSSPNIPRSTATSSLTGQPRTTSTVIGPTSSYRCVYGQARSRVRATCC